MNCTSSVDFFVSFDNLHPFDVETNFLQILRETSNPIINKEDLKSQMNSILTMRRLRKFHFEFFKLIFSNLTKSLGEAIINSDDEQYLNSIFGLLFEIFSGDDYINSEEFSVWIKELIPKIVQAYISKRKENMKNILSFICSNIFLSDLMETLLNILLTGPKEYINFTYDLLMKHIECYDVISLENMVYWDACLELISELYNLNDEYSKIAKDMLIALKEKLGSDCLKNIISNLKEESRDLYQCMLSEMNI